MAFVAKVMNEIVQGMISDSEEVGGLSPGVYQYVSSNDENDLAKEIECLDTGVGGKTRI